MQLPFIIAQNSVFYQAEVVIACLLNKNNMKKIILLLLVVAISFGVVAQTSKKDMSEAAFYLQKSKKQKTASWLMLGSGTVMFASGYVWLVYEGMLGDGIKSTKGKVAIAMFYTGGAAMLGSIPLFIAAARNKGISLAVTAGIKMETTPSSRQPLFVKTSYPALSLKFNLN